MKNKSEKWWIPLLIGCIVGSIGLVAIFVAIILPNFKPLIAIGIVLMIFGFAFGGILAHSIKATTPEFLAKRMAEQMEEAKRLQEELKKYNLDEETLKKQAEEKVWTNCKYCGTKIKVDETVCSNCGAKVK